MLGPRRPAAWADAAPGPPAVSRREVKMTPSASAGGPLRTIMARPAQAVGVLDAVHEAHVEDVVNEAGVAPGWSFVSGCAHFWRFTWNCSLMVIALAGPTESSMSCRVCAIQLP